MFKHLGKNAIDMLLKIFNLCLRQHEWFWKGAEVIFLRKPGKDSYSKPGAYRPICNTSYIGKLLEGIISIRIELLLLNKETRIKKVFQLAKIPSDTSAGCIWKLKVIEK